MYIVLSKLPYRRSIAKNASHVPSRCCLYRFSISQEMSKNSVVERWKKLELCDYRTIINFRVKATIFLFFLEKKNVEKRSIINFDKKIKVCQSFVPSKLSIFPKKVVTRNGEISSVKSKPQINFHSRAH